MKRGSNRPVPCSSTSDRGLITWNRRSRPYDWDNDRVATHSDEEGPPTHRFSIPRPDDYEGPLTQGPSGTYPSDARLPMSEIKPLLMEKPQYFKGAHDDIERFLGDCRTYFETF